MLLALQTIVSRNVDPLDSAVITIGIMQAGSAANQIPGEAIMRGTKTTEYRSGPTNIRGRILIYASLGRYGDDAESEMLQEFGIADVEADDLPRGVIIGSVELYDSDEGEWYLRNPQCAEKFVEPVNRPNPVWFYPF